MFATPRLALGFPFVFVTDEAGPWEGGQVAMLRGEAWAVA